MQLNQLIEKVNHLANNFDFKSARTYIEINLEELKSSNGYMLLNSEARQLYQIILKEKENVINLSRLELHTINEINKASNKYDITILRMLLKTCEPMLKKKEVQLLLSPISKSVLTSMGYSGVEVSEDGTSHGVTRVKLLEGKQKEHAVASKQPRFHTSRVQGIRRLGGNKNDIKQKSRLRKQHSR